MTNNDRIIIRDRGTERQKETEWQKNKRDRRRFII